MTRRRSEEVSKPSLYWAIAAIVLPVMGLLTKQRVAGVANVPQTGSYVIAPNHHSEFDPMTVAVAVWKAGRAPRFLAKESLFRVPVIGWALRRTNMVPVSRTQRAATQALSQASTLIETGNGVIVYPEGTLTRDPDLWPMRGKSGAVRIALAGDIPLVPMAHWGEQALFPRYGKLKPFPLRRPVDVIFGEPVDLDDLRGREHTQDAIQEGTDRLMRAVADLLAQLRGEKAPDTLWDPRKNGQSESGRM